jgi:membrane protein implicated in regulation of membrane protease activity
MSYFLSLGAWNWFVLGVLLLAIEILTPGSFILWLGLAALVVGALAMAIDMSWQVQFALFAVLSVVAVLLWRRFRRRSDEMTDQPFLNRRPQGLVGTVYRLDKPIVNGSGSMRVGDTVWRIAGDDTPAGARVRVTRADGAQLFVERIDSA